MISLQCATTHDYFHDAFHRTWRRNGRTQLWKTRPNDFRIPVKNGLYSYGQITHDANPVIHCACEHDK